MFSIYRDQSALTSLNATWQRADSTFRETILQASRLLDQALQASPQEQGESRDGAVRITFEGPLGVTYEVDEQRHLVRILRAWVMRQPATDQDHWE